MRHISSFTLVRFTKSSRRHRIGHARAMHVMNSVDPVVEPATRWADEKWHWFGADDRGLELEITGVVISKEEILIIHVMPRMFRRNA